MGRYEDGAAYIKKYFGRDTLRMAQDAPELAAIVTAFAFHDVPAQSKLDDRTRFMAILAVLLGCQGQELFGQFLRPALKSGVEAKEIREIVYQSVAYIGLGRAYPFLSIMNDTFRTEGITLPLAKGGTTDDDPRRPMGTQAQVDIFGSAMKEFWHAGPEEKTHINYWLAANCFGDYYTRPALTLAEREMVTFCYIAGQGGCEAQLIAHAKGNMNVGNDRLFLIDVVSQCLPYIGYPRSLNALGAIETAMEG